MLILYKKFFRYNIAIFILLLSTCTTKKPYLTKSVQSKDMETTYYLAIDGMPGAGKSTIIYDILKRRNDDIIVIPE
ncbi:MAG: hypothetical protein ACRYE9_01655, partial [Janthinobacterium lividum]